MINEPIDRSTRPAIPLRRRRSALRPNQVPTVAPLNPAPSGPATVPSVMPLPLRGRSARAESPVAARASRRAPLLAVGDLSALAAAAYVADRQGWVRNHELLIIATLLVMGAVLPGWQRPRFTLSASEELPQWLAAMSRALLPVALWTVTTANVALLRTTVLAMSCIVIGRVITFAALRAARRRGRLDALVVVGTGATATEIFKTLASHPEYGVAPCGFVGPETKVSSPLPGPLLAPLPELSVILDAGYFRRVVVDPDGMSAADLDLIVNVAATSRAEIHIASRGAESFTTAAGGLDHARCHPLMWVPRRWSRPEQLLWKRLGDLAVSVSAIVVLAPSLLLIAAAVRLSSRGPILFRQERLGQHGQPISVLKFRSMRVNEDSDVTWSVRADDRITPIGRFLRATSLDELPQLFCIAQGEMSLVGARPERPFFVRRFERLHHRYPERHRLRVGLTGLSQIHHLRGDTSIAERTRFDNFYIDHWSMWSDAVVLVRTLSAVVRYGRSAE